MKTLDELDHYEVLEVKRGAALEEIERAYPIVRAAYDEGSLASYSVFDAREKAVIRDRIDQAYRVLSDVDARAAYDEELGVHAASAARAADERGAPSPELRPTAEALDGLQESLDLDLDEDFGGEYTGARLRRTRMRRGIEIEQISEITRINPNYLRCIEEDAFPELPAAVYTRGFVTAYARAIGLDPQSVAKTYMARFDEARGEQRGGGLIFGRREPG